MSRKHVTLPWNAASWRQHSYAPRVTKVHDPVGEKCGHTEFTDLCCGYCGHHRCSCPPPKRNAPPLEPSPETIADYMQFIWPQRGR